MDIDEIAIILKQIQVLRQQYWEKQHQDEQIKQQLQEKHEELGMVLEKKYGHQSLIQNGQEDHTSQQDSANKTD